MVAGLLRPLDALQRGHECLGERLLLDQDVDDTKQGSLERCFHGYEVIADKSQLGELGEVGVRRIGLDALVVRGKVIA